MSRTRRLGLSEEIGSWKIIWMPVRALRSDRRSRPVRSVPLNETEPRSAAPLGRWRARWWTCRTGLAHEASVSPRSMEKVTPPRLDGLPTPVEVDL